MKTIMLLVPLLILFSVSLACAGHFEMDVSGSGDISFFMVSSDGSGTIGQGYSGSGDVGYSSTYSDGVLTSKIDVVDGSGRFGTILKPDSTWTADANYVEDGSSNPDSGTGVTTHIFLHSWSDSFSGSGEYTLN